MSTLQVFPVFSLYNVFDSHAQSGWAVTVILLQTDVFWWWVFLLSSTSITHFYIKKICSSIVHNSNYFMTKNTPVDLYILQKHNPECRWGRSVKPTKQVLKRPLLKILYLTSGAMRRQYIWRNNLFPIFCICTQCSLLGYSFSYKVEANNWYTSSKNLFYLQLKKHKEKWAHKKKIYFLVEKIYTNLILSVTHSCLSKGNTTMY